MKNASAIGVSTGKIYRRQIMAELVRYIHGALVDAIAGAWHMFVPPPGTTVLGRLMPCKSGCAFCRTEMKLDCEGSHRSQSLEFGTGPGNPRIRIGMRDIRVGDKSTRSAISDDRKYV